MKKILFLMFVLAIQSLTMQAQTINRYIPDGWEWKNVSLDQKKVISSTSTAEIAVVPPYYYANYSGQTLLGSAVVTELEGYHPPYDSGWMVKSMDLPFEEENGDAQSPNGVPTNIIPNLNGLTYAAFYNCTNMKKIVLPPTIKKIGALAFENCALTELVCMAVTPPTLVETSFDKVSIGKIIVPKGTLQTYKATAGWNNFTIEEGAETYSNHQMVECNGAWYEVVNGEASLVNSDGLTDPIMPETVTCLIKGEWKTVPVTGIREWSVGRNITLNDNITDIPLNYGDNGKGIAFYVKDTHPTLRQLTKQVITNKKGNIAYYVFGTATVPHGVTSIANNALNYCTEVYLPTTLVSLGVQSTSAKKYFTSAQPPSSSSSYGGYVPEEYLATYNTSGYGSFYKSDIPAGYECLRENNYTAYWNPKKKTCILKNYIVSADDIDANGIITLPSQWYFSESIKGSIEEYDCYISKADNVANINKVRVPEGIKTIKKIIPYYGSIQEIHLPSTLENCKGFSELSGLEIIDIDSKNKILDSRDNCNAVIKTATNTLLTACSATVIPTSVEHIGDSAFYRVQYTQDVLFIPAKIKTIGKHAFEQISKTGWASLQIDFSPSSQLTCIEDSAFWNSSITKMTLPESVESIKNGTFADCHSLKDVSFGSNVKEIGEWAFRECAISSIVFPDALQTIGDYAFTSIPTLESVTFGKSLKKIGALAFSSSNITQLKLPDTIEEIGYAAFSENSSLESIDFGNSNPTIGGRAFRDCVNLISLNINNESIGDNAFENCTNLTTVTINNGSIGYGAFRDCTNLTTVTINSGSIGEGAFRDCTKLNSVTLGDGITTIGEYAFSGCAGLASIKIPASVTELDKGAFEGCSGLNTVTIDSEVACYADYYGTQVTKYIIGDNIKSIGASAFKNCRANEIVFGNGVEYIGENAFEGSTWYDNQPTGLIYIGKVAYKYKGEMPANTFLSIKEGTLSIGYKAFSNCIGLTSIDIPNSVTSIGERAFNGCTGLTSIIIPNSVKGIGWLAFDGCTGLTSIDIPNSVTSIGHMAFSDCSSLTSITIPDGVTSISAFSGCSSLTSIKIPNSVTSIGYMAFSDCSSLTSINIPSSVTSIGNSAFSGCSSLQKVIVSDIAKWCGISFNDKSSNPLYKAHHLYSDEHTEIKELTIPNSVTSIGNSAFAGCSGLTSVIIPNNVTSIGESAFYNCDGLTSVIIPNNVTSIGESAFRYCFGLTSIAIPNSVTCIGNFAFSGCSGLTSIYSYIENPSSITGPFFSSSNYSNATLYVPYGTKDKYLAAEEWKNFANIVEMPQELEPIEDEIVIKFDDKDYIVDNTPVDLNSTIINDMYISMDNKSDVNNPDGFYNSTEKCIVINKATSASAIATVVASDLGSSDFINNFTGIVIEVNGKGSVKINAQTIGNNKLAVKIGSADAKNYTQATKGDVTINYDVTENTYVYIYAVDADNQQQSLSMDITETSDNAVKVYSVTVTPDVTAIETVPEATIPASTFGKVYSVDGKQLPVLQNGISILKMTDGTTRKVVK